VDIEALNEYTNNLHKDICELIPDNPCIGVGLAINCLPNPIHYACLHGGLGLRAYAYLLFVQASIAYQVIDETYDIATLGEYDLALNTFYFYARSPEVDQ
jgi:hypothetical protein